VTLLRLAIRNLLGAGLRTWLNAVVLSLVFVAIITAQGLLKGMNEQTARAVVEAEYGGGQFWHPGYDPHDPLSLDDAYGPPPPPLRTLIDAGAATPVLVVQGGIYPEGRFKPVLIKGIDPGQAVVGYPAHLLRKDTEEIPALIGTRMAASSGLAAGDVFVLQWRDRNGMFDAQDARVVEVVRSSVQSVDKGQIWVPIERLRRMTGAPDAATILVVSTDAVLSPAFFDGSTGRLPTDAAGIESGERWPFRDQEFLLSDIRILIRSKMFGSMFIYAILLFLALLAVFDTQVFSIFKRQKEIGTLLALGMTRGDVVRLFAIEGSMSGVFAAFLAAVYGTPLLSWFAGTGWHLPETTDSYGFSIGDVLYPVFSADVVLGTGAVLLVLTALVSFLPTRRIARVKPTEALRGKVF
jgi:ABC-type lipoprotein release transport system permease subunit